MRSLLTQTAPWRTAGVVLALGAVIYAAWFAQSPHFGFYEDDYGVVTRPMYAPWDAVGRDALGSLRTFRQGKPLCFVFLAVLSKLAGLLGGRTAAYGLAWLITTANASLVYFLFRRLRPEPAFAWTGALAFCLWPVDNSVPLLCHAFGLRISCLLFLIALHLRLSGRVGLAYAAAALSFLTYEVYLPLFAVAPWLEPREKRRGACLHAVLVVACLAGTFALRKSTGEGRASRLSYAEAARTIGKRLGEGPRHAAAAAVRRVSEGLGKPTTWGYAAVLSLGLAWAARRKRFPVSGEKRLLFAAAALIALAYAANVINPVDAINGRASRVHAPAALGFALAAALAVQLACRTSASRLALPFAALVFGSLVSYGGEVQTGYRRAWDRQVALWSNLPELCADWRPGDLVVVERTQERGPILPFAWSTDLAARQFFRFRGSAVASTNVSEPGLDSRGFDGRRPLRLHETADGFRRVEAAATSSARIEPLPLRRLVLAD